MFTFCPTCSRGFKAINNQRYCSTDCQPSRKKRSPGPFSKDLPSATVGMIAELAVHADLLIRGYAVFAAVSPACYCDILAKKGQTILEIEVRASYKRNGRFYFFTRYHHAINCLALWDKETQEIAYLNPGSLLPISL